jgi:hypothetical protein
MRITIPTFLTFLLLSNSIQSQNNVFIYQSGVLVGQHDSKNINNITFDADVVAASPTVQDSFNHVFQLPEYSIFSTFYHAARADTGNLQNQLIHKVLSTDENQKNTILLLNNTLLQSDGFSLDATTHSALDPKAAAIRLHRLMSNCMFPGYKDTIMGFVNPGADLTPQVLASTGIAVYDGWNFRVTGSGEMVRFKQNIMQMVGDVDESTSTYTSHITLTPVAEFPNAHVFIADSLLKYSRRSTTTLDTAYSDQSLLHYLQLARTENPEVSKFVDLVEKVMKTSTTSNDLIGVKATNFYTVLMPSNSAMNAALAAGLYPAIIDYETDPTGANKALRFVQSHFLVGKIIADDNLPIIYPFAPFADNPKEQVCSTLLSISNDSLGLINEKPKVVAYKYYAGFGTTYTLRFYAKDIVKGSTVLVKGNPAFSAGANSHLIVSRVKITYRPANDYKVTRSNRMACRAVLHEVNTYFNFVNQ